MKRKLSVLLAACMLLALAACGGGESSKPESAAQPQSETSVADASTPESSAVAEEPEAPASPAKGPVEIAETVLVDQDGIKVTVTGYDEKGGFMGPEIKIKAENTTDTAITIQARDVSVNGYMADTIFSCDVAAGKNANDSITIMSSTLEDNDIDVVGIVELRLHIFDSDSWDAVLDTEMFVIETSAAADVPDSTVKEGVVLVDQDGIVITYNGVDEGWLGAEVLLSIANNTDQAVTIQARDVAANDYMVSTVFSADVTPGKVANTSLTVMSSSLEENDIETLEELELYFHVFASEGWDTVFDSEVVNISVG